MILAIDVGNSNIVLGAYKDNKALFVTRMNTDHNLEADQYAVQLAGILALYGVENEPVEDVAIASVVPAVTPMLLRALTHFTSREPLVLTLAQAGEIEIDIENPAELGNDIIASAIAVYHSMPLPAVIIDLGTATKLTALDVGGRLRGVSIAPGVFLSLGALVQGASLLRGVSMDAPQKAIGRNTNESMKSGIVLGTACMLDGMIDHFEKELGEVKTLVATGGAAQIIIPHCKRDITYSDTLLLDGLILALQNR